MSLQDGRRAHDSLGRDRTRLEARAAELALEGDSLARGVRGAAAAREKALVEHDVIKLQVGGSGGWFGWFGWLVVCVGGGEVGFWVGWFVVDVHLAKIIHTHRQFTPSHANLPKVKRLRDVLAMSADEVTSLEARKAALKLGLEEQRQEVELHRCVLGVAGPLFQPAASPLSPSQSAFFQPALSLSLHVSLQTLVTCGMPPPSDRPNQPPNRPLITSPQPPK